MRILLLTPPMTQLNTPYPATAYLTAFLRSRGYDTVQADPAIDLIHRLFSPEGLLEIRKELDLEQSYSKTQFKNHPRSGFFIEHFPEYQKTIAPVMAFLQNQDPTLAMRLVAPGFLPRGSRFKAFEQLAMVQWAHMGAPGDGPDPDQDPLLWAFGSLGLHDRAKYLCSLYLDDLADVVGEGIDLHFQLSRYGERLAASEPSFEPLRQELNKPKQSLIARMLAAMTRELIAQHNPDIVGFTVPFPGNMLGALRMAQEVKRLFPHVKTILGGGYVNTELRQLKDPQLFDFFDFLTFDDGEAPLLALLEVLSKAPSESPTPSIISSGEPLLRTMVRGASGQVLWQTASQLHDIPQAKLPAPTYDGLPLHRYLSVVELLNPMHRLWSDGRWNKLTLAHGCYWRQCSFCDVTLDYIGRYEESKADLLVDRMVQLTKETGQSGFHFVDEACPPKVLAALSQRLQERGVVASWWGNIRFEKSFTENLVQKLVQSGLVAVSGGLEVASDRLLDKMKKGVTVEQVARVAGNFAQAGVLVHAYLMYGFPTQTVQETVDSLERVRQLFANGCIHSAFWHRFACTIHSPIGRNPETFGIRLLEQPPVTFATNDIAFEDPTGVDHDLLGVGLRKAVYNYMHGLGLDEDVRVWFDGFVPKAKVPKDLVARALGHTKQRVQAKTNGTNRTRKNRHRDNHEYRC